MQAFPPLAVLFDLDGVLLDSFEANCSYYGYIAAQMGLGPLSSDDRMAVHRLTHEDALIHFAGARRLQEALAWGRDFNARQLQKGHKLFPGVKEVIEFLYNKVPLAVGTNRNTSAEEILRELGLRGYFKLVLTSGQAPAPKPEKVFMDFMLATLGFSPDEVVYVGDSLVDEQLCVVSNVRLVGFRNRELNAWRHVNDFKRLPSLLGF